MSKRILDIAFKLFNEDAYDDENGTYIQLNVEKFAELIVRECIDVITETRWHLPPTQQQIAVGIKEHFGVNE